MQERVRAIIVEAGSIALIERHRSDRHYFVFPGGGVEAGEILHQALIREVLEETGLLINVEREVVTVTFPDHIQRFYLASVVGGEFGAGTGPEYTSSAWCTQGTYRPLWLPLSDISQKPVYPEGLVTLVVEAQEGGWAERPTSIADASWEMARQSDL